MKIGLIDVDNKDKKPKFPNLALMKLSTYHKKLGDQVELVNALKKYDIIYMSKVFDYTEDYTTALNCNIIIKGGIGYDLENKLPYDVEHTMPDYSLYNINDTAYGFVTRGCPRNCEFCNVTQHQGNVSRIVADVSEFWNGQKNIVLLDPNTLASKNWKIVFQSLIDTKANIDFSQGLDIRLMSKEMILMLNDMKIKIIHFAWDYMKYENLILERLELFKKYSTTNIRKIRIYVLINFDTTHEEDLYRINILRKLGYDPYVMIFDKYKLPKGHINKRVQRWVNNVFIWRSCETFEEYNVISNKDEDQLSMF